MKEQIINTSADLFLSLGFKSVTMDDIAQNMGISKKTIYAHFPTKTKLIEAVTLYVLQKITEGIEEIKSKSYNPIEELFKIKQFTTSYLKDEKSSPQFQLEKYYPKIYREVHKSNHHLISCSIEENLNRGIATGDYRSNIPVDFISKIYFVGITGIKNPSLFPPELQGLKILYDNFLEYHLRAIATPAGLEKLNQFITNDI
ncbi:TetR/AcrR family transcriptional regulator [Antarcticibacterium arcticum]|uniref:TetR/AcrR family transcriptional regulator n=1 Tax=Antarcticibacterium arcticum TaxID=2585771 RepID=A0A5B8YQL6_9FLAO|nr:TetR/AcrR family transcriptional regulator [Antarcticibacterium arcticum]QED38716.1 TetR/AcrR family transcriptional regulator [Antarcticibacterium arcticum]